MKDRTIIYYSANTEDPAFEKKITDDLVKKAGDIPIISVTRKPMDLGTNICVGETPVAYENEWKQLLIGLKAAKTRFCLTAEDDCLYPPSYFTFTPPEDNKVYYYDNLWIIWRRHSGAYRKTGHCEGAEMCGREFWISRLEAVLPKTWDNTLTRKEENRLVRRFFPEEGLFDGEPVISFKTGDGMSQRTTFINKKVHDISYWGNIKRLKERFLK